MIRLKTTETMLENIKADIYRLIEAYEKEKAANAALSAALEESRAEVGTCREQIAELNRQIDNLKLQSAFTGTPSDNAEARKKVDRLIKEIDKCISLMQE